MNKNKKNKIKNEFVLDDLNNSPILFNKKMKKIVIKPLKHIYSDTGRTRHYTPAAQEWFNSIYSFNNTYTKTLPTADKNLINLIKSYFNSNLKLIKYYKIKQLATRYKRLSAKKIFVGKGDLKHTNDKAIITIYVYNTEKMFLLSQLKKIHNILYNKKKSLKKYVNIDINGKETINYNRPFTLNEYLNLTNHYEEWYFSYILHFTNKLNLQYSKTITLCETLKSLIEKNLFNNEEKNIIFNLFNINTFSYPSFKLYISKCYLKYTKLYFRLVYWLWLNNVKFSVKFIENLTRLVMNIYNKKIEFNIVSLKKMHFNSDIFTQVVSLKLRNRNNKLYRVLKASLRKLKLRNVRRPTRQRKGDKNEYFINKIRNDNINSMFKYNIKDSLNNLLLKYFPWKTDLTIKFTKLTKKMERYVNLSNYVIYNLKHRKMAGVRVEAKGRLTRRFTASRSVFKMKWKGGLKNVDSSFKGLSATMLRGHVKSNTQYTLLNSKNRNGAFGVKGWVSNK
jgi:hypothetical protein